jgi:hypothetical protein
VPYLLDGDNMATLREKLLQLIDKLQISEAFILLDRHVKDSPAGSLLKEAYISARYDAPRQLFALPTH